MKLLLIFCSLVFSVTGLAGNIDRVFVIVLENTNSENALSQPFLGKLAREGAYLSNYHGVAHPSQPNYIALISGSTAGVWGDFSSNLDRPHLGDLLEAHGKSWKSYAEGYPGGCFQGSKYQTYARRHEPFISFKNIQTNFARCDHIVPASSLAQDIRSGELPDFALYVPDVRDDGHDTGVAFADQWLSHTFGPLLGDPRFIGGTLFVVTFDEDEGTGPNQIYTALYGAGIQPGSTSSNRYDHYSLLRTIEDLFRVGNLGQKDALAQPFSGIWNSR